MPSSGPPTHIVRVTPPGNQKNQPSNTETIESNEQWESTYPNKEPAASRSGDSYGDVDMNTTPRRSNREKKPKVSPDFENSQTVDLNGTKKGTGWSRKENSLPVDETLVTEHSYSFESKSKSGEFSKPPTKAPVTVMLRKPGSEKPYLVVVGDSSKVKLPKPVHKATPASDVVRSIESAMKKKKMANTFVYTHPVSLIARLSVKKRQELLAAHIPIGINSIGSLIFLCDENTDKSVDENEESLSSNVRDSDISEESFVLGLSRVKSSNGEEINLCSKYPVEESEAALTLSKTKLSSEKKKKLEQSTFPFLLCCCRIESASYTDTKETKYCQALDTMEDKVVSCGNAITNSLLVRPSVKIPFMAVCEVHRLRSRMHQCCPGCGRFCSQGKFYQCKKSSSTVALSVHVFHKQCEVLRDSNCYCPHCGEESTQNEVNLQMNETYSHKKTQLAQYKKASEELVRARMSTGPQTYDKLVRNAAVVYNTESTPAVSVPIQNSEKVISSSELSSGPERTKLEEVLSIILNGGDDDNETIDGRPRRLRPSRMLYAQVKKGNLKNVIQLLMDGADPNMKFEEHDNESPLHVAASRGNLLICHCLIAAGADLKCTDDDLWTPLMYASEKGHLDVANYLLKAGANVISKAEDGMTSLHLAARDGKLKMAQLLMSTGKIDVNIKDRGGWTPLIWASEHEHTEIVKYFLSNGANPSLRDNEGNTGLHWAAYSGSVAIAVLYLERGCDLNCQNEHGDTPVHIAARQNHYDIVVMFLSRGANIYEENNGGKIPINCCIDKKCGCYVALRVHQQLREIEIKKTNIVVEKLIHRDISYGKEAVTIPCVNGIDSEDISEDFQYVMENVETVPVNINNVISSLQNCFCRDDCFSILCVCSRNSVKCWYTKEGRLVEDFPYVEPPLIFECNKACKCWMNCRNRVVQKGIMVRLQLFKTLGRGWGVRTLLDIPKGTFICEYIGELISDHEADRREDDSYLFDLDNRDGETYCIDARRYGNISRFINHLCEPNLLPVKVFVNHQDLRFPRICMFASRDVKAGEELGFDYGEKFWIIKWKHFTCTCGSPKCKFSKETIHQTISDFRQRQQMSPS